MARQNIRVSINRLATGRPVACAFSREKNVLRLDESLSGLEGISNLNQKYQIRWKFIDDSRRGIHHFDKPVKLSRPFAVDLNVEENASFKDMYTFKVSVTARQEEVKDRELIFRLNIAGRNGGSPLLEGKTVHYFENSLQMEFKVILTNRDPLTVTVFLQDPTEKIVYVCRRDWQSLTKAGRNTQV